MKTKKKLLSEFVLASAVAFLLHSVALGTSHIIVFFSRNTKSNRAYFRRAHAIIMVYGVSAKDSFEHIESWLQEISYYQTETGESPVIALVGNKIDLPNREVPAKEAEQFAERLTL
jgi:hypothetical protein